MDIHAPEGPTHSLKDFAIHILIVTIGILIALGLEGVRETWREHKAIVEARERFQVELRQDQEQLRYEMKNVQQVNGQLEEIINKAPELAKTPEEFTKRVTDVVLGFYFFSTTSWDAALASGIVSHMKTDDVTQLTDVYLGARHYQDFAKETIPYYMGVKAYFQSRHSFRGADLAEGEEKLRMLRARTQAMAHLAEEFKAGLIHSIGADGKKEILSGS